MVIIEFHVCWQMDIVSQAVSSIYFKTKPEESE